MGTCTHSQLLQPCQLPQGGGQCCCRFCCKMIATQVPAIFGHLGILGMGPMAWPAHRHSTAAAEKRLAAGISSIVHDGYIHPLTAAAAVSAAARRGPVLLPLLLQDDCDSGPCNLVHSGILGMGPMAWPAHRHSRAAAEKRLAAGISSMGTSGIHPLTAAAAVSAAARRGPVLPPLALQGCCHSSFCNFLAFWVLLAPGLWSYSY